VSISTLHGAAVCGVVLWAARALRPAQLRGADQRRCGTQYFQQPVAAPAPHVQILRRAVQPAAAYFPPEVHSVAVATLLVRAQSVPVPGPYAPGQRQSGPAAAESDLTANSAVAVDHRAPESAVQGRAAAEASVASARAAEVESARVARVLWKAAGSGRPALAVQSIRAFRNAGPGRVAGAACQGAVYLREVAEQSLADSAPLFLPVPALECRSLRI